MWCGEGKEKIGTIAKRDTTFEKLYLCTDNMAKEDVFTGRDIEMYYRWKSGHINVKILCKSNVKCYVAALCYGKGIPGIKLGWTRIDRSRNEKDEMGLGSRCTGGHYVNSGDEVWNPK